MSWPCWHWLQHHHPPTSKDLHLQLRCLSASKSWSHPGQKEQFCCHPRVQRSLSTSPSSQTTRCRGENLKAPSSIIALSEEKRKLPRVRVQLGFQMCPGSEVKDKSTRMWRTFDSEPVCSEHSSLEGGGWADSGCVSPPPLTACGLVSRRWIMTPQLSCLLLWQRSPNGTEAECQPC